MAGNITMGNETGECPISSFNDEAPEYTVRLGYAVTIGFYAFGFVTVILMWVRRHKYPVNQLNIGLLSCTFLGACFAAFSLPVREIIGRKHYPCDLLYAATMLWFPLEVVPFLIYWFAIHRGLKFQIEVRDKKAMLHDQLSLAVSRKVRTASGMERLVYKRQRTSDVQKQIKRFRYLNIMKSTAFSTFLASIMLMITLALVATVTYSSDSFLKGCVGCSFDSFALLLFGAVGAAVLILSCLLLYFSWHDRDAIGYSKDMRRLVAIWSIVFLGWAALDFTDPGDYSAKQYFNWSYLWFVCGVIPTHVILIVKPTWRTFSDNTDVESVASETDEDDEKKDKTTNDQRIKWLLGGGKKSNGASRKRMSGRIPRLNRYNSNRSNIAATAPPLKVFLNDRRGVEAFQKYLIMEFSIENLEFYLQADAWRKLYSTLPPERIAENAFDIYEYYIAPGAILQVNLPDSTRVACTEAMKDLMVNRGRDNISVPKDIFDGCIEQVLRLMKLDAYYRFTRSPLYREWHMSRGGGADLQLGSFMEDGFMEGVQEDDEPVDEEAVSAIEDITSAFME